MVSDTVGVTLFDMVALYHIYVLQYTYSRVFIQFYGTTMLKKTVKRIKGQLVA